MAMIVAHKSRACSALLKADGRGLSILQLKELRQGFQERAGDAVAGFVAERFNRRVQEIAQQPSYGRKKVKDESGIRGEWDFEQLAHIAEIAERLGRRERVEVVAADFWRRGIKDHRGLPWGQVIPKRCPFGKRA